MNDRFNTRVFGRKILLTSLGLILVFSALSTWSGFAEPAVEPAPDPVESGAPSSPVILDMDRYVQYMLGHADAPRPAREVIIDAADYSRVEGEGFEVLQQYEGSEGASLLTGEAGLAEWTVDIEEAGLYNLSLLYYPIEGKSSSIERELLIDGERPFQEAGYFQFDRIWTNQLAEIERDNQDNDLRPRQIEAPQWNEKAFQDSDGYEAVPFLFYLSEGTHTLTLVSSREPAVIKHLRLYQEEDPVPYEEKVRGYESRGLTATKDHLITVEGEAAIYKSSPTLYPFSERSSAAVNPYSASKTRINAIGGLNWRIPGQWIEWEVDVPETGLYNLSFKTQQNFVRGIYSTRTLTINGKVPFREMQQIPFRHQMDYRMDVMGGEEEPYLFELTEGIHTIRLTVNLGEFASLIREVEESLYNLNSMYRKMLMITGSKPDNFRDYQLEKKVPDLLEVFASERDRLQRVSAQVSELSGESSDQEALLRTMAEQLNDMFNSPDTIPRRLASYKANTGGLGTWVQQAREQPLTVESFYIASPGEKLPKQGMGLGSRMLHETRTFMASFFTDYSQIGNVSEDGDGQSVTVWIGSGRDQANTMKAMIDETFTPATGINVNLKLVDMGTLLPATLAGQGPDVAMQIGNDLPVNFAMRNAAADLTQFSDFYDVKERFRPSALVPFSYDGGVYALPETQTFDMLFYRKDVLEELGLEVPETWNEVSDMLSVLSKNHMQFGLPVVAQPAIPGQNIQPNSLYAALLFQNGGAFYRDEGKASDLDSRIGIETFKTWTEYYTDYRLEREYDFSNRFRTGEMPIGISDYTIYNQLTVFAPEIRGMWGFTPIPGTLKENGQLDRSVSSNGSSVVMLNHAEDKEAAWAFMKWWTSDEAQTIFGREMEGLMGAAARYPTANIQALDSLPWPVADYNSLREQFQHVRGIPEVPGGYFTGRHLFNAFYKSVVGEVEARESIMDYVQYIQDEIRTKRQEFGLPE